MATNTPALLYRGTPIFGTAPTRFNISNKVITSNLATITTSAVHGITQVGTVVTIQGVDTTHDGTYAIHSIPTTSTFTYVSTTATQSTTAVSPVGIATFCQPMTVGFAVTNKVCQNYVATLTVGSAHGLAVGDLIAVTIGDTIYDTKYAQVIAIPTTTTFSYISATQTGATTVVTQGSFGKFPALYTVPASTNTIATNIVVANPSASSATFTVALDGVALSGANTIAANSSAFFDLKQLQATTKTITGASNSAFVTYHISGMTVV